MNYSIIGDSLDERTLEKIARLRKAINENTYEIKAEELAEKLIDHMLAQAASVSLLDAGGGGITTVRKK